LELFLIFFSNDIKEQAKWTCDCGEETVSKFEKDFKEALKSTQEGSRVDSLANKDNWITWLDNSASAYLHSYESSEKLPKVAKKLLLSWSFLW
jgi:hypothetical protein